jgi:hypothetical protein
MAVMLGKPVASGTDVASLNPRDLAKTFLRNRTGQAPVVTMPRVGDTRTITPPTMPTPRFGRVMPGGGSSKFGQAGPANPYQTAIGNIRDGGTGITSQVKSPSQNAFLNAVRQDYSAGAAGRKKSLTDFVKEAYAGQADNKKALDEEKAYLEGIFNDSGIVNELANTRAQRRAGVMMATKMAMDRAKRTNNVNRMMGGNNSYLDRAYGSDLARIAADASIADADLARDDAMYVQGQRNSALGARDRLLNNYLQTSRLPYYAQRDAVQDDINIGSGLAGLEDRNTIYETPEQRLMREIRMAEQTDYLNSRANPAVASVAPQQPRGGMSYLPRPPQTPIPNKYRAPGSIFNRPGVPSWVRNVRFAQ